MDWTIGEVGAHMAISLVGFISSAQGRLDIVEPYIPNSDRFPDRLSGVTSNTLAVEPTRNPVALADLVSQRVEEFLSTTTGWSASEPILTPWYGDGASLSLATATGILLGEQLLHGYDIATTLGVPWPIDPDHARLVIAALTSMMPLAVNPQHAAEVEATYDVRVKGGPRFIVTVDNGSIHVDAAPPPGAVHCHIWAEPVALLLVAYGRISQWTPMAKGKLLAWGRRPWLGLRFKSLFFNP